MDFHSSLAISTPRVSCNSLGSGKGCGRDESHPATYLQVSYLVHRLDTCKGVDLDEVAALDNCPRVIGCDSAHGFEQKLRDNYLLRQMALQLLSPTILWGS